MCNIEKIVKWVDANSSIEKNKNYTNQLGTNTNINSIIVPDYFIFLYFLPVGYLRTYSGFLSIWIWLLLDQSLTFIRIFLSSSIFLSIGGHIGLLEDECVIFDNNIDLSIPSI